MRTLHVGLRVEDLERSLGFYTSLGYDVIGTVPETELGRVADLARSLLGDPDRLKEMGEAMKRVARPDAADEIAEGLLQLAS